MKMEEVQGLNELVKAFAALGGEAVTLIDPVSVAGAKIVQDRARANVQSMGALDKAIKVGKPTKSSKSKYKIYSRVYIGKKGAYGIPLELGHAIRIVKGGKAVGTAKERPFLRPAADKSKEEVLSLITGAMNKAIDGMGGIK